VSAPRWHWVTMRGLQRRVRATVSGPTIDDVEVHAVDYRPGVVAARHLGERVVAIFAAAVLAAHADDAVEAAASLEAWGQ
jgi:hypothetical protein